MSIPSDIEIAQAATLKPITEVAARIDTIPYEILTATSERVKRVYYAASF